MYRSIIEDFDEKSKDFLYGTNRLYEIMKKHDLTVERVVVVVGGAGVLSKIVKDLYCRWHIRGETAEETRLLVKEQMDKEAFIEGLPITTCRVMARNFLCLIVKE